MIESDLPGAFMSRSPVELIESVETDKIQIIIGANKHDGSSTLGYLQGVYFGPTEFRSGSSIHEELHRPGTIENLQNSRRKQGNFLLRRVGLSSRRGHIQLEYQHAGTCRRKKLNEYINADVHSKMKPKTITKLII